ncbi:mechanosensitive ion channel domain-containing protein [Jeongeupia naejangsanensis]|uniref:Mechanosensitive ion channel n=1 Tax=Jeongeupia naejangsanensis TaxID=613195 RepID=A0ABS2BJE4_9NEIS|nr:mechanosensitive ion channel domain-containing protein [Jeongeupia naejangsanensis]MBM3115708.1 mechanosensitive ion channel [Jeongeupia naejangsanensis]
MRARLLSWLTCLCLILPVLAVAVPLPLKPVAASAPAASGAAAAELGASLDTVIRTLENESQRQALVAELRALRVSASAVAASAPEVEQGGMLGWLNSQVDVLRNQFDSGFRPLLRWRALIGNSASELRQRIAEQSGDPWRFPADFVLALGMWMAAALALGWIGRHIGLLLGLRGVELPAHPRTRELMLFIWQRIAPWALAFALTLYLVHLKVTLGGLLAMMLAYAILVGALFSALSVLLFSLRGTGLRRAAARVLIVRSRHWQMLIGMALALADAFSNPTIKIEFGPNLAGLLAAMADLTTIALTAAFAIAFRRPIGHLIQNRPYAQRHAGKALTETLQFVAALWHLPVVLLCALSAFKTLANAGRLENTLNSAALSTLLMIGTFLVSTFLQRYFAASRTRRHRRRSPYLSRLLVFGQNLCLVGLWLVFAELFTRLWGLSLLDIGALRLRGRTLDDIFGGIVMTVLIAWLLWILLDTLIEESMNGGGGRRGKTASTRVRTILPLFRNAILGTLLVVAAILSLANLGIDVTPLIAGAGVIGLAVGFGAQTLVKDLITGLFILIEDTIAVGDYVDVGGHAGTVEGLTIRTVKLRDSAGAVHAVPFSQIASITNYARGFAYALFEIGVTYDADLDRVMKTIRDVGTEMRSEARWRRELLAPIDVLGVERFDASAVIVKARFKTRPLSQWEVARAFNLRLKKRFDALGIAMPFPQMDVHFDPPAAAGAAQPAAD